MGKGPQQIKLWILIWQQPWPDGLRSEFDISLISHTDITHSQSGLGFEMTMLMSVSHYQKSQNGPSLKRKIEV